MKIFLTLLAIGFVAADKLDRTYLPPPGAQFAGGNLGKLDTPLDLPHHSNSGVESNEGSIIHPGNNGEPIQFGDKTQQRLVNYYTEKVPTTTISYAFSQTTTFPPGENFETTTLPINPVTGLPINVSQVNLPYGLTEGLQNNPNLPNLPQFQVQGASNNGIEHQPGFSASISETVNLGPAYAPDINEPSNQFLGQYILTPENTVPVTGSSISMPTKNLIQIKYPDRQRYVTEQQEFVPTSQNGNQDLNQFSNQNMANPGDVLQFPGVDHKIQSYAGDRKNAEQQKFLPSTAFLQDTPVKLPPIGSQSGVNNEGFQGPLTHGTYSGLATNVQNPNKPIQGFDQNQENFNVGDIPSQQNFTGNQNLGISRPEGSNVYQPGLSSSTILPVQYFDDVSSPTSSNNPSSISAASFLGSIHYPERPQAAADRNAVIINYENIRTPNGYAYSFDTSNGIHADESGIVDNGTKAQGEYSYTGDDGKIYSVIYTADENGFQPRGDHLPTPPPIPEAIKRVIEQAARDKAAGVVDDGSYDEAKYGDKKYQGTTIRLPQSTNNFENKFNGPHDGDVKPITGDIKPIAGIHDTEYDEDSQGQYNNKLPISETEEKSSDKNSPSRPLSKIQELSGANRRVLVTGKDGIPLEELSAEGKTFTGKDGTNELTDFGGMHQESSRQHPALVEDNMFFSEGPNQLGSKIQQYIRRPTSSGVKDSKYPGSQTNYYETDRYSEPSNTELGGNVDQDINSKLPLGNDKILDTNSSLIGNRKPISSQGTNEPPKLSSRNHSQNEGGRAYGQIFRKENTDMPSVSDYIKNAANEPDIKQQITQHNNDGYHYKPPKTEFRQTTFPTRFSSQEVSSVIMTPENKKNEFEEGTTRKPFITPNVYNQNDSDRKTTTRRPFTTPGVTSPSEYSYSDYDDGENYANDEGTDDDRISSTRYPAGTKYSTTKPYTVLQTTSKPKYTPTYGMRKENLTPGQDIKYLGTMTPVVASSVYTIGSTAIPTHSSRFGSTKASRKPMKYIQRIPSTTVSDHSADVVRPATFQTPLGLNKTFDYKYQTTGSTSRYKSPKVALEYQTTGVNPEFSHLPISPVSTTQNYSTYTNSPAQSYSSTTEIIPTSEYQQGSGFKILSRAPEPSKQSLTGHFQTGYHYGPPKFKFIETAYPSSERPVSGFFNPFGPPNVYPNSSPDTYQTVYQQGPSGYSSTTLAPSSTGNPDTLNVSHSRGIPPSPEDKPKTGYPGAPVAFLPQTQSSYGSIIPSNTPMVSPSTIATTPYIVPSEISVIPTEAYSTTYRPGFQIPKNTYVSGPVVDGFGRPITSAQDGIYTEFPPSAQDSKTPIYQEYGIPENSRELNKPVANIGPEFVSSEQSTIFPESYDQSRVIGEDFSGPKQPQSYDVQTGYHYK